MLPNQEDENVGILTADMQRVVTEQRLGFVASVNEDGSPNLSPKGTMVVLDDDHIIFGEIRSPNTVANVRRTPILEINFVDPFSRKGYRFRGTATYIERESDEFRSLYYHFERWGKLQEKVRGIVKLKVERALKLTTPAYDIGVTEEELINQWRKHFDSLLSNTRPK